MATHSKFEDIKHTNEIGQEYWSARELFEVLEYTKWDKFLNVIDKAKKACKNSGQEPNDHFPRVEKLVELNLSTNSYHKEHKEGTKYAKYYSVPFAIDFVNFAVNNKSKDL